MSKDVICDGLGIYPDEATEQACREAEMEEGIERHELVWSGITMIVSFQRNWLGKPPSEFHPSHLEIETVKPKGSPLPFTGTGYRSQFLAAAWIDEAGGAVVYVRAWLDEAAKGNKEWQAHMAAERQLCLF